MNNSHLLLQIDTEKGKEREGSIVVLEGQAEEGEAREAKKASKDEGRETKEWKQNAGCSNSKGPFLESVLKIEFECEVKGDCAIATLHSDHLLVKVPVVHGSCRKWEVRGIRNEQQ